MTIPVRVMVSSTTSATDLRAKIAAQVDSMLAQYNERITQSLYPVGAGAAAAEPTVRPAPTARDIDAFPSLESVGRR